MRIDKAEKTSFMSTYFIRLQGCAIYICAGIFLSSEINDYVNFYSLCTPGISRDLRIANVGF